MQKRNNNNSINISNDRTRDTQLEINGKIFEQQELTTNINQIDNKHAALICVIQTTDKYKRKEKTKAVALP